MEFLKKLFKALNSAQHPWQVTLAITLGMITGLTPMSGTQTLLILLIVFLVNVHLGLFFAASALFAGISYLFDPWMEQFGFMLLTSESMKEIYTLWYNSGLIRLSHFNNTLVMGATVISLLLALPLFFGLNFLISLYRERIAVFLNGNKWLAKLGIFKVSTKKEPLLRWWGAVLYAVVIGALAALLLLVVDPLLEWGIEKGASKLLKRDVRVGSVETHLLKGSVGINRIEVAGERENIDAFSVDSVAFDLNMNALLFSRTHIEKIELKGVGFQTEATMKKAYGGAIKESAPEGAAVKEEGGFEMPSLELPTPKELLARADLRSQKLYEEAKVEIAALEEKWRRVQKEQLSAKVLAQYQDDLRQMQSGAKTEDPAKILALAQQVATYKKRLDKQQTELIVLKSGLAEDQKRVRTLLAAVKKAPQEDYARLRRTYTLDAGGGVNLFGLLFSQKIAHYLHLARGYYAQVEPYLRSDEAPQELPPRGEGRWVRFAQHVPIPDLWIARTLLSGEKGGQRFEGVIKDISDNQKALGSPLTLSVNSDGPLVEGLHLEGEDNRLGEQSVDSLRLRIKSLELDTIDLKKVQIEKSRIGIDAELALYDASRVAGKSRITFSGAKIGMEESGGRGAAVISDLLQEIHQFGADVKVEGAWASPSVRVESDLDEKIAAALKRVMAKEAERYKKELKLLLDQRVAEQTKQLTGMTGGLADAGSLIDRQSLSLDALGKEAGALLESEKSPDKLKKMLKF